MSDSSSPTVSNRPETEEKVNDDGLDSMDSNIYYLSVYDIIERVMDSEGFGFAYEHSNNEEIKDEGDEEVTKSFLSFRFQSYGEFISGGGSMGTTDDFSEAGKAMNNELGRNQNNIEVCPKTVASLGDLGGDQEDTDAEKVSLDLGLDEFSGEDKTVSSDSDSDSIGSSDKFSIRSSLLHPFSDGFSSDSDSEISNTMEIGGKNVEQTEESHYLEKGNDLEDEDQDALQELKSLETGDDATLDSESDEESKEGQFDCSFQKPETSSELETQWEHQELVEQLKMEIKKIRATGLPTIYEESDSLKIVLEDLKPWKIEDKCHQLQHHGTIREVHKFYKSYRERMRKFDIFNYQKMYAIDFLGLKNPLESFSSGTSSAGSVAAVILQECWPFKPNSHEQPSPITKFRRELDSDLEMFYVGQLCISWEFLHWQYSKALELWESDPHGFLHYNEVAGEFQQFQVLLQRFLEDEPFKGPRVLNYVKSRCNQRHLLQVPVIREDSLKRKGKERKTEIGKEAITSVMLVEIIEESIRIFWKFVCADDDACSVVPKYRRGSNLQSHDPAHSQLLQEVQTSLQKKKKKLAELLRSESGIMRKLLKYPEESSNYRVLYFFSRVDLKLVSRVLNMSKLTTDQLIWCSNKINKVQSINGKVHVEPSFLLFPCS